MPYLVSSYTFFRSGLSTVTGLPGGLERGLQRHRRRRALRGLHAVVVRDHRLQVRVLGPEEPDHMDDVLRIAVVESGRIATSGL